MTMITRHQHCRLLSIAIILVLQWTGNHAFPARDVPFNVTQPDGSVVQVLPNGDSKDNYLTDRYGYGVEQDDNGYYVYVDESETGEVVRSSEKIGKDGPKGKKKEKRIHKKTTDCKKKRCGGTPEDPKKKTKRSRTLRGTHQAQDFVPKEETTPDSTKVQSRRRTIQTSGVIKNLVILLHFKDHAEHKQRKTDIPTRDDIDILMNSEEPHPEFAPAGSLKSIYKEVSYGKLTIESTVTEWFVTEQTEAWYADGDSGTTNLHEALRDSLDYLDQNNIINFTDFDSDQDGTIDAITFLHSGYAAEWMGPDQYRGTYRNRIWSHKWNIWSDASGQYVGPWVSKDGTSVYDYHIEPALWGIYGTEIGHVGVIAHETGHFMDMDDLYDTNGGGNGIGNYCFMASSWGWDKSQEPPGSMTCWTKAQLGWLTPQKPKLGVNTISDSVTTQDCIKIGDGEYGFPEGEYLLIENRQPKGLDSKIPQGGLAIFHIDETIKHDLEGHPGQYGWPLNGRHYHVALLQADGRYDLERQVNHGDGNDLFHGDGVDSLMPSADKRGPYPNTDSYQKGRVVRSGVEIYGISKSNDTMTFIFSDGTAELPSAQPTPIASSSPTATPSGIPTTTPAPSISSEPSVTPAPTRSPYPTIQPSSVPSIEPSNSMAPSDLPSLVPTDLPSNSAPSTPPSQQFFTETITMIFQCMEKGQECQFSADCCNNQAECKVVEKRRKKKVCTKATIYFCFQRNYKIMEALATKSMTNGVTRKRSPTESIAPTNNTVTRKSARSRNASPKILSSLEESDSAMDHSLDSTTNGGGSRSSSPVPPANAYVRIFENHGSNKRSQSPANVSTTDCTTKTEPYSSTKPFSMFDTSSIVKKRKRRLKIAQQERGEEPEFPVHVCGLPMPEEVIGVCAKCKSDRDSDTILLCDGEGCEKEYHMACCTPPLDAVPSGEFYCFDCSIHGSAAQLEEYLEEHDSKKMQLDDPQRFAETLLREDVWNELNPKQAVEETEPTEVPRSELDWTHLEDPNSLIGKSIRIYCPKGNHYHNGRIVDVRSYHDNDTDCLVRFHAGSDGRKTALTSWVSLEEHCVAVCTDIVWAKFSDRIWKRARLWSRTSRELVPVMNDLIRLGGALRPIQPEQSPRRTSKVSKPEWGLLETVVGKTGFEYLELAKATNAQLPGNAKTTTGREATIMHGLVESELEQQERVKRWRTLPLKNPMHPKAITLQDEYGLGTLDYQVLPPMHIYPSPLIPQGLDRAYITERIARLHQCKPSKDMAASLDCLLEDRPALSIQEITAMQRAKLCGDTEPKEANSSAKAEESTEPNVKK